jgi:hypothetical protein
MQPHGAFLPGLPHCGQTCELRKEIGADSRNRTVDPIITNDVLYQLS